MCGDGRRDYKKRNARVVAKELLNLWNKQWHLGEGFVSDESADKFIQFIKYEWPAVKRLAHELHEATKEETFWVYTCQPVRANSYADAMDKVRKGMSFPLLGDPIVTSATDTKPATYR